MKTKIISKVLKADFFHKYHTHKDLTKVTRKVGGKVCKNPEHDHIMANTNSCIIDL